MKFSLGQTTYCALMMAPIVTMAYPVPANLRGDVVRRLALEQSFKALDVIAQELDMVYAEDLQIDDYPPKTHRGHLEFEWEDDEWDEDNVAGDQDEDESDGWDEDDEDDSDGWDELDHEDVDPEDNTQHEDAIEDEDLDLEQEDAINEEDLDLEDAVEN